MAAEAEIVIDLDTKKDEKYFRLSKPVLLLTWPGWLDKVKLEDFLYKKLNKLNEVIIAHEIGSFGTEKEYKHTHACCLTEAKSVKFDVKTWNTLDFEGIHGNYIDYAWELRLQKWNYCCKPVDKGGDKDNVGKKKEESWVRGVLNCKSEEEALIKWAPRPSDVMGVKAIYASKRLDFRTRFVEPTWPWQVELIKELIVDNVDDRKVIWLYDKVGRCGKNAVGKWLMTERPTDWYYVPAFLGYNRTMHDLSKDILKGLKPKGIWINVPANGYTEGIYEFCETLKDGSCLSGAYNGLKAYFDSPWIVIASNSEYAGKWSADRLDCRKFVGVGKDGYFLKYAPNITKGHILGDILPRKNKKDNLEIVLDCIKKNESKEW